MKPIVKEEHYLEAHKLHKDGFVPCSISTGAQQRWLVRSFKLPTRN